MATLINKVKGFAAENLAGMEKPTADFSDLSIKNASKDSFTLEAAMDINNPYSHDIPICQVSYKLLSAKREIASGTIMDPGDVKGNETTRFNVPMKVPYDFIISIMKDVGSDWDMDYECQIGLTMRLPILGKFTSPLSKEGSIKLPTISDLF